MPISNILYKYQIGANTEPINYAKSVPTTDGINSTEAALKNEFKFLKNTCSAIYAILMYYSPSFLGFELKYHSQPGIIPELLLTELT